MSIRVRVTIIISFIVAIICAANLVVSLVLTQKHLLETSEGDLRVVADVADEYMTAALDLIKADAMSISQEVKDVPASELPTALRSKLDSYENFLSISILNKERVIASCGSNYMTKDLLNSPAALRAFDGKRGITSTHILMDGHIVSYVCVPMDENHILAATLDGMYFTKLIEQFQLWDTGYIFILDKDGTIIAHVRENWVQTRKNFIDEAKSNEEYNTLANFLTQMVEGKHYSGEYILEGEDKLCVTTPIRGSEVGWTLGVVAPINESPLAQTRESLFLTAIVFLAACLVIAIIASGYIARPIAIIDEQNIRLKELKEEAELASATKSNFLANTSHEMRTPLNAIIGFSELQLGEPNLEEGVRESLVKISNSGHLLLSIINDLLDISKIESGKFEMVEMEYDVPSFINDTVSLNIMRKGSKPIEFKLSINPELPSRLLGDEMRVKQIFNNLLSNAFKYTKQGEIEWSLDFEEKDDELWLISTVRDSGIGIREEDLKKLFSEYNQLDMKSNRSIEGTGLGLSILKHLADLMQGSVDVKSTYGEGSIFTVRILQKRGSDVAIGQETVKTLSNFRYVENKRDTSAALFRISLPNARVLIVDDVKTNLDVAKGMLKPYGMKMICVSSGIEAIDLIREGEYYDLIFMDHMMPIMDGVEAVHIIRNEIDTDYARNVPIVALTANAISGNEQMFLENGFQEFLHKPIDIIKMDAVIRKWIPHRKGMGGDVLQTPVANIDYNLHKIDGVDIRAGVSRFGGDAEAYLDVLRSYAQSTEEVIDQLYAAYAQEDWKTYGILAHGIKGSSRGIVADTLGDSAEKFEDAAKEGDLEYIREQKEDFHEQIRTLILNINTFLCETEDLDEKPVQPAPNPALLIKLKDAAKAFAMDDVDDLITELEQFAYEKEGELVLWLRARSDMADFEEIVMRLTDEQEE